MNLNLYKNLNFYYYNSIFLHKYKTKKNIYRYLNINFINKKYFYIYL